MSEVHASLHQSQKPSTAFGLTSGRIARKRWGDHLSYRYGIWSGMQHLQQKSDETFASDQKDGSQKTIDSHLFEPDSDSGIHSGY